MTHNDTTRSTTQHASRNKANLVVTLFKFPVGEFDERTKHRRGRDVVEEPAPRGVRPLSKACAETARHAPHKLNTVELRREEAIYVIVLVAWLRVGKHHLCEILALCKVGQRKLCGSRLRRTIGQEVYSTGEVAQDVHKPSAELEPLHVGG